MSNTYFTFTLPAVPGALIDAVIYNEEMTNISEAFEGMPPAAQFADSTLVYSEDGGSQAHKSAMLRFTLTGPYVFGEKLAIMNNVPNNSLTTVNINNRGSRPLHFDGVGGSASQDMLRGGFYTLIFDGSRFTCMQMSRRGIVRVAAFATVAANTANVSSGTTVGSIEFFAVGEIPTNYYPSTTWDIMSDSVDSLTSGVVSSTDLVAWIRRT